MKLLCVILSFSIFLMGCYSHNIITANSPKSEYEVSFRLKDGTHIISDNYEKVENGWKVEGNRIQDKQPTKTAFSGIIFDSQIKEIVTNEYNAAGTAVAVILVVGLVIGSIALALELGHGFGSLGMGQAAK